MLRLFAIQQQRLICFDGNLHIGANSITTNCRLFHSCRFNKSKQIESTTSTGAGLVGGHCLLATPSLLYLYSS